MPLKIITIVPIRDYIEPECYKSLLSQGYPVIVAQLSAEYLDKDPLKNKYMNVVQCRNLLRKAALGTDADYFMMADSDTVLPENCVKTLLSAGKDIISGWCKMVYMDNWIGGQIKDGVYQYFPDIIEGIAEADAAPLGCMLVKRKVLEQIEFQHGMFEVRNNVFLGDTGSFALSAKNLGYKLYMDSRVVCKHLPKNETRI